MAVRILWKDGKEPQDQDNCFGKNRSLATYTGVAENADAAVEVTEDEQQAEPVPKCQSAGISSGGLGEIIARASEKLAQDQRIRRPVEGITRQANNGGKPNKQQKGQVVAPTSAKTKGSQTVTPRIIEINSSDDELYLLAQKRMEARAEGPLVIESNLEQRRLAMMSRAVRGSVVVEIEADTLPQSEAKPEPVSTAVLRFPLSEERQRADQFYQATGIKFEDFVEELLRPGWTVAGMISPRENAKRIKLFFCNCVYDAELAKLRAAKAVDEFLHKKRSYRADARQAQLD